MASIGALDFAIMKELYTETLGEDGVEERVIAAAAQSLPFSPAAALKMLCKRDDALQDLREKLRFAQRKSLAELEKVQVEDAATRKAWQDAFRCLAQAKFGPLPEVALILINAAPPENLQQWMINILSKDSLTEVFGF